MRTNAVRQSARAMLQEAKYICASHRLISTWITYPATICLSDCSRSLHQIGQRIMTTQPNPEQLQALRAFAASNGRTWKAKLNAAWCNGTDTSNTNGALLRQIRNAFGPQWLITFNINTECN
jgi:hypothetical protein